jgi:iron(III) transport system substrate-binding protein
VQWVRDSTGVITARVLAEKAAPKADIVLGLAASSLLLFNKEGMLEAYQPAGADKLKDVFRSKDGAWTGMDAFLGVVCFNTAEGGKAGLKTPASYKDLLDPKLKGQIVMPHPASSGTGYLMVAAWLQVMGKDAGWKFMDGLHDNIAVYTHSGSAPCVQAAKGERMVGLGFDMRGGLGRLQERQRTLLKVLRHRCAPRREKPAEELSGERRRQDGQDRSPGYGQ